jgi:hypothetical protein
VAIRRGKPGLADLASHVHAAALHINSQASNVRANPDSCSWLFILAKLSGISVMFPDALSSA